MKGEHGILSHEKCYLYKDIKNDWEEALANGNQRSCPECGVGGVKDDSCTHMTCDKCKTKWCYFCGKKESDLDKSNPSGNIFSHNDDWETNSKRCPLFLREIGQIDDRWSTTSDLKAKQFFHKILTYKEINKFFKKYSEKKFKKACKVFPTMAHHGYDLEEAKTMDLELIKRA